MSSDEVVAATPKSTPVERLWAFVLVWSPFLLALLVAAVFVALQRRMDVDEFGFVADLASDNMTRGLDWQAELVAARTHWVTALYVAIVLMLPIAGISLQVIWKARPGKATWIFLGLCASTVWVTFYSYPSVALPYFLRKEIGLVFGTSWFDAEPCLLAFLSGLFSTAVALTMALSLLLRPLIGGRASLSEVVERQTQVRTLLSLATILLVVGVIGVGLFHRMASASTPPLAKPAMEALGAASTIFSGAFYSTLLAAAFAPVELAIRRAGASAAPVGATVQETEEWLKKQGLQSSLPASLMKLVAILGPLLAGVLQNLAELKP